VVPKARKSGGSKFGLNQGKLKNAEEAFFLPHDGMPGINRFLQGQTLDGIGQAQQAFATGQLDHSS
jgi:hypothetical protein